MLKLIVKCKCVSKITWSLWNIGLCPKVPWIQQEHIRAVSLCLLPYLNTGSLMEMHPSWKFRRWPQSQSSKYVFLIKAKHRLQMNFNREKILSHFDCLIAGDSEPSQVLGDKVSLGRKAPGMSLGCCRCFIKVGPHFLNFVSENKVWWRSRHAFSSNTLRKGKMFEDHKPMLEVERGTIQDLTTKRNYHKPSKRKPCQETPKVSLCFTQKCSLTLIGR